jgi:hypothetical protein
MARCIYKTLELLGDDPGSDPAGIAASSGLTAQQVAAMKGLVVQAGARMA